MQNCNRRYEETEKWLIKGRRENEEQEYHHKRKEAHKIIMNKKKLHIKSATESTEEDQKENVSNNKPTYERISI